MYQYFMLYTYGFYIHLFLHEDLWSIPEFYFVTLLSYIVYIFKKLQINKWYCQNKYKIEK